MRRALAGAAGALVLAAFPAGAQAVALRVHVPARVAAHVAFPVRVNVVAAPGAFDVADARLWLRVRLAPECGGSFDGTTGRTAIDRRLKPPPAPGLPYAQGFTGRVREPGYGTLAVCAFVEQRVDHRQFATSTSTDVAVTRRCTKATRRLARVRRRHAPPATVRRARRALARACG